MERAARHVSVRSQPRSRKVTSGPATRADAAPSDAALRTLRGDPAFDGSAETRTFRSGIWGVIGEKTKKGYVEK